jgi:hypothetical protein
MMHIGSGQRDEWEFEYTAVKLADGAKAQREFRLGRVTWWTEAKAKVMAEVKDAGIEVTESVAASISNYATTTQMDGPQIRVRTDLQKKLVECHNKIQGHQQAAAEYDGWVQVLAANPESRLKLTHADWLYFFGKR